MKTSLIAVAAFGLLAQAAAAQFQGLGAADPSQQLKTTGMMNTFQAQNQFNNRNERKEPLVQGTSDPSDAPAERPPERTTTNVPQPQPQPVAVAPTPWPSPSPSAPAPVASEPLKPVPVQARNAARPAATWNPASAPAAAPAGEVAPSARLSRVQSLVDEIKRRREGR